MGIPEENGTIGRLRTAVVTVLGEPGGGTEALARVCRASVEMLPVDGASVSLMTGKQQRETLYTSDETVSVVETLQFTLGEGPCFEAFHHRRPVLVADLAADPATAWPVFAAEIAAHPVGAIFAFPLQAGANPFGAMDLYRRRPGRLTAHELAVALQVVDVAALALLGARHGQFDGEWVIDLPRDREVVHQAVGMLIAEHHLQPDHALVRLRGYAFASGRAVAAVAADLVTRRLHPADVVV